MWEAEKQRLGTEVDEWNTLADYGKEHPLGAQAEVQSETPLEAEPELWIEARFKGRGGGEMGAERLAKPDKRGNIMMNTDEEEPLGTIRQKHIDWLAGKYKPTGNEFILFNQDKGFYNCAEYIEFRKKEIDAFAEAHYDIYHPSDEEILEAVQPFVELVQEDGKRMLGLGMALEKEWKSGVEGVAVFFAEKFGLTTPPNVEIIDNKQASDGSYNYYTNILKINASKNWRTHQLMGVIAHEIWHARQHKYGGERYDNNFANYYKASMDADMYCGQLVEKEAFEISDRIEQTYQQLRRPVIIEEMVGEPAMVKEWNERYEAWLEGDYSPLSSSDDDPWMKMAVARNCSRGLSLEGFDSSTFNPARYCYHAKTASKHPETMDGLLGAHASSASKPASQKPGLLGRLFKKGRKK